MATTTTNLGLPRPEASDNVTLANDQALIDAIDANAAKKTDLTTHVADAVKHITAAERTSWNAKETTAGAQAKVDTHANATTGVHGATSAATASKIAIRDASGRMKVAAPSASDDVARKDTVDNAVADVAKTNVANTFTNAQSFQTTLGGSNRSLQTFIATDGKQYAWVMRTEGTFALFNATDNVTVAIFGPAAEMTIGVNTVWHAGNNVLSNGSENGYQKLASGVIIQWGRLAPTLSGGSVVFPIAFPNAVRQYYASVEADVPSGSSVGLGTKTGFQAYHNSGSNIERSMRWLAVGY